ncbi:LysR substrate-binding domain-containing protein [Aquimarina algicola]|uniref:LysR family transcriptional regulator n=1 Tax=Aquimarina algicola TaxID=2589995 RepID=A0A504J4V5_9FLAO|nr:LysR substrate-binding domain-containing protein [Aquimarina algicola]TPN81730.1 LysR family transcriptional regulator [Aquimarina algicola]
MTIQQLKYIVALDHKRHYVKAAEECFVAQPTLTIQVKKLEEELGTTIFNRDKTPLEPTPIGEILIAKARSILRETNEFKEFAYNEKTQLSGEYTLGIIPTIAPYLLPLFLDTFLKANPEINLVIKEMQTEHIIEALHNGTLDISILSTPLSNPALREIHLYQEPFLVYCKNPKQFSTSNTVHQDDLTPEDLLLLEEGHCFRNQVLNICKKSEAKKNKHFVFESGSIQTIKNLVKAGLGYSLVPQLSVLEPSERTFIKPFQNPKPTREISLVVNKSFTKEKLIETLLANIKRNLPDEVSKLDNYIKVRWK